MSCQHGEDACCQHCLEKVQKTTATTTTKPAAPTTTEKDYSHPEKTMTLRQKRISVLVNSSLLAAGGAMWYFNTKNFFKISAYLFDRLLDAIGTRTEEEEEQE